MIDNVQVASDQLVLQLCAVGNHDLVALVGNDDAGARKRHALAEPHVAGNRQVVQVVDVWDRLEALLKVLDGSVESTLSDFARAPASCVVVASDGRTDSPGPS